MNRTADNQLLRLLRSALATEVRWYDELQDDLKQAIHSAFAETDSRQVNISRHDGVYVAYQGDGLRRLDSTLVAGPLSADHVSRASESLAAIFATRSTIQELERQRLDLASELEVVGNAILAITAELDTSLVLRRIVDLARNVAGARYAALGVPGPDGNLETFITSGLSPTEEKAIGALPKGRGLLGLILKEQQTIRVAEISEHPESVGFPPNHPPMRSFLGVPIVSRGEVLGNLYLTEKRHRSEFTAQDARRVEVLARHAAVAIENARLYTELEHQRAMLGNVLERMPEAVLVAEPNPERITLANSHASNLLGWEITPPMPLEEWLSRNPRHSTKDRALEVDEIPIVRSLRRGEVHEQAEIRVARSDGKRLALLVNSAPLHDSSGNINAAIVVFQDITDIKDAEQLKDDFLSLVSHELRTPLTTIRGGATMLERDGEKLSPELRRDMLADIGNESRRLATIIENLVQLANVRAGRLALSTEPVLVSHLIRRAVQATREFASEREFVVTLADQNLLADADDDRIDEVLRNLLHNACKYSPADSPVEVEATRADGMVRIAVRDHGSGIEESELPDLFERFHRTRSAMDSSKPGMGLGLYLCRHVVGAHGGSIHIELPEDGGTRVVFTIPELGQED